MHNHKIAIIGSGRVGSALALLLNEAGYTLSAIASRSYKAACTLAALVNAPAVKTSWEAAATATIVFITTPDREIAKITAEIAQHNGFCAGQFVFHTSGALSSDILHKAKEAGAFTAAFHPLQTFADNAGAIKSLPGSLFTLEGDEQTKPFIEQITASLQGHLFLLPKAAKPLYHAAACIASNYLVTLASLACTLLADIGMSEETARQAILPLMRGTLNNIEQLGCTQALTGPISRNDAATIQQHLTALKSRNAELELYCHLGQCTTKIAYQQHNLSDAQANKLNELFSKFEGENLCKNNA